MISIYLHVCKPDRKLIISCMLINVLYESPLAVSYSTPQTTFIFLSSLYTIQDNSYILLIVAFYLLCLSEN